MDCPHCDFHFKILAANGNVTAATVAPILCEQCLAVSLLDGGKPRKLTPTEMEAVKESPAWKEVIEPVLRGLSKHKSSGAANA